jgi:hypothetical protein
MKALFIFLLSTFLADNIVTAQKLTADQQAAKKVVVDFFKWYKNNSSKLEQFNLYKGKKDKDQPPWVIDWKEVERYFAFLRKNVPYVGETYINSEREAFKKAQQLFVQHPDDEIVPGFDYDRYTGGQESPEYMVTDWLLGKGTKGVVTFITPFEGADSKTEYSYASVDVVKEKGVWKLARNIKLEGED